MKYSELKTKDLSELNKLLSDLKVNYLDKRLDIMNNRSNKTSDLSLIKKQIAQIKTSINERKLRNGNESN